MDKIVGTVAKPPKARRDDDLTDRLSSRYTVMILVVFAIGISLTQWVGKPIYCWVPKHFTGSWTKYANSFCWVNNTYYLPFSEYIPREHEYKHRITYYQWIPWILLSQAFFFWAPSALWHGFNSKSGIDSDDILQAACTLQNTKLAEKRDARLRLLGVQLDRFLRNRRPAQRTGCCRTGAGRRWSCYLVSLYLLSKCAYLANALAQLFVLGDLFNADYERFGPEYFEMYSANRTSAGQFVNSIVFPRVTMCDFRVRLLGNVQRYTVQCALPLNLYLEKMYLFFWFWLVLLAAVTGLDLVVWSVRALVPRDRRNFVANQLRAGGYLDPLSGGARLDQFVDSYLRQDGAFLLRMIAHNTSTITTADVTGYLWEEWKRTGLDEVRIDPRDRDDGGAAHGDDGGDIYDGYDDEEGEEDEKRSAHQPIEPDPDVPPPFTDTPPSESDEKKPLTTS